MNLINEKIRPFFTDSKMIISNDQQENSIENQLHYTLSDGYLDIDYENANSFRFILSQKHQSAKRSVQNNQSSFSTSKKESLYYNRLYDQQQHHSPIFQRKKIFQFFFRFLQIRKFVSKLTKYIHAHLNEIQFELIDDASSNFDTFKQHNSNHKAIINKINTRRNVQFKLKHYVSGIFYRIQTIKQIRDFLVILESIPIINPQNNLVVAWNIFLTGIRVYFLFLIPIEMAFQNNLLFSKLFSVTLFFEIFLIIDFILRFNTIYYDEGKPVRNRRQIFEKQLNTNTVTDLIAILPLLAFNSNEQIGFSIKMSQLVLVFFLFQNRHIQRVVSQWQYDLSKNYSSLLELLKLIISVWYLIHIFACLWFFIGMYQQQQGNNSNWLQKADCLDYSSFDQYLLSFYFSSVTLFTVGFGDIYPQNYVERIFCIIYMMITSIQFSYSLSTVGSIIMELKQNSEEMKKKMRAINNYMNQQNISGKLQYEYQFILIQICRIREYLSFIWNQEKNQNFEEEYEIINLLPHKLKDQLLLEAHQIFFKKCTYFRDNFDNNLQNKLIKYLKQITIMPGNYIDQFTLNSKDSRYFCFIKSGQVEEIYDNENGFKTTRQILKKNESFNLKQFLLNTPSKSKYKSIEYTQLLVLEFSDFFDVLKENQAEYEKFIMFTQDLQEDRRSLSDLHCNGCSQKWHSISQCPQMHFICDKEKLIKSFSFNREQLRKRQERNEVRQYFNTLCDRSILFQIHQYYQEQNEDYIKLYTNEEVLEENTPNQRQSVIKQQLFTQRISESSENESDSSSNKSTKKRVGSKSQQFSQQTQISTYTYHRESLKPTLARNLFHNRRASFLSVTQAENKNKMNFKQVAKLVQQVEKFKNLKQVMSHRNSHKIQSLNNILSESSRKKTFLLSQYQILQQNLEEKFKVINQISENLKFKNQIENEMQLEILRLKKNMELLQENSSEDLLFEIRRTFVEFKPYNNFENVLKSLNSKNNNEKKDNICQLLLPYLKYPRIYIKQYIKNKTVIFDNQMKKVNLRKVIPFLVQKHKQALTQK